MKRLLLSFIFVFIYSGTLVSCKPVSTEFVVFRSGEIQPILVLPEKPKGIETKAANLFSEQFQQITGTPIKMVSEKGFIKQKSQVPVFLGNTQASRNAQAIYSGKDDGFVLGEKEGSVYITASKGLGILNAVATFFEDYTHTIYYDVQEKFIPKLDEIKMPGGDFKSFSPAFEFRQAYFPQSLDYDYANWNKLHLFQENWAVWGHNLHKLIDPALAKSPNSGIYAIQNGKPKQEQYCFSSDILFQSLSKGIEQRMALSPDAIYYSIAPNDNSISCACAKCSALNGGTTSSSNSVATLINKLAKQYPSLIFSTHAYLSTLNPPKGIKMANNSLVLISTIDFPKGIPISESKQADRFKTLVSAWKAVCNTLYVWDYTVQYTNYFDFFPNLPSLQKDLIFFKANGIRGVLEQGSEDQYSLFGDWKSFAISKLLWKPDINLDTLRYSYFELAYPSQVDFITDFLLPQDAKQVQSGKGLNIYGTVNESLASYLNIEEFDLFFYELSENYKQSKGKERLRLEKALLAMCYLKLELSRSGGVSAHGYGQMMQDSIQVHKEVSALLNRLSELSTGTQVKYTGETGDSISAYKSKWDRFILNRKLRSKIIDKPINMISKHNGEFKGQAQKALNDGAVGFLDYETNWLLFNTNRMEIEIPVSGFSGSTLELNFLNDPRHLIVCPDKISVLQVASDGKRTLLSEAAVKRPSGKDVAFMKLNFAEVNSGKLIVLAEYIQTQEEFSTSTRKPSMACDELLLY